ncbi:uncharacterized protein LOC142590573 isoform X2 [Dermacentor variabilis]|uniref:uncharacterized protein LOC142590573 isoform X2 n=1 Tax=Dermacentor variabilis TaxID=34621 RepID=UPI003F5BF72C
MGVKAIYVKKGRRKHGSWKVRNTTYYVSRKNGPPTVRVEAYDGRGWLDEDVSELYVVLFSSPYCFVMRTPLNYTAPLPLVDNATHKLPDYSRCLLWAPVDTSGATLQSCEEGFFAQCNNVGLYPYRYRKRVCEDQDKE